MILAGAGAAALCIGTHASNAVTGVPALGGPFTLTAADDTTVTDRTYRGKWPVLYFVYTYYPDACPTTLNAIAGALGKLGSSAEKLQALFITVDPRRDTSEVMGEYVKAFGHGIIGFTGSPDENAGVAKEHDVYIAPHPEEGASYSVDHSSLIYLVDPKGKFMKRLSGGLLPDRIAQQLHQLIGQSS